jgi:hypothetical protein
VSLVEEIQTKTKFALKKMICQTEEQKEMFLH